MPACGSTATIRVSPPNWLLVFALASCAASGCTWPTSPQITTDAAVQPIVPCTLARACWVAMPVNCCSVAASMFGYAPATTQ